MSKKITEYFLKTNCDRDQLNEDINEMIRDGWQPFGSPTVCVDENNCFYSQAMVK